MAVKNRLNDEKKFWSKFASRYDTFMGSQISSYATLVKKILGEMRPSWTVLEVAAGTGLITLNVARAVREVHAIDITPEMITRAEEKARAQGIKNIVFSVDDAYALPFADCTYDAVICSNALHNMREPQKALLEMRRVTKPAGILITPTFCHGEGLKSRAISHLMALIGFPAYHRFTVKRLEALIKDSGLEIEKSEIIKERIPMAYIVSKPAQ